MSLIPTIWIVGQSPRSHARKTVRPIRPKPLIITRMAALRRMLRVTELRLLMSKLNLSCQAVALTNPTVSTAKQSKRIGIDIPKYYSQK